MKKIILSFLALMTCIIAMSQTPIQADAVRTKNMILKTNRLLGLTHMAVKNGKNYTGDLSKAVQYERFAKKCYLEKDYKKAAAYTFRAREFANAAITANKAKPTSDGTFTTDEKMITNPLPTIEEMDKELLDAGIELPTDADLITNGNLNVTL
jgi:hypothetical protein